MSPTAYRPGVIAQIVALHADYYGRKWNFGLPFEAKVARELSDFLVGFRDGVDHFAAEWDEDGRLAGTVILEGPSDEALGHLRWLIVADHAQGRGLGRRLLGEALAHADAAGWDGVYLTTFDGLGPARRLYEQAGFVLVSEADIDQWSGGVREQRFERRRAEGAA